MPRMQQEECKEKQCKKTQQMNYSMQLQPSIFNKYDYNYLIHLSSMSVNHCQCCQVIVIIIIIIIYIYFYNNNYYYNG